MSVLIILNEGPYGGERAFSALRLCLAMRKQALSPAVRLFLISDGVFCALRNQLRPEGSYNVEAMLAETMAAGVEVQACSTCLEHRGLATVGLIAGVAAGTIMGLADWVSQADRVVTF